MSDREELVDGDVEVIVTIKNKEASMKIYDGDNIIEVSGMDIVRFNPDQLVAVFEATAVFYDLVTSLDELIAKGVVTSVCDEAVSPSFHAELKAGLRALTTQMDEVLGEDVTSVIWTKTAKAIQEVR